MSHFDEIDATVIAEGFIVGRCDEELDRIKDQVCPHARSLASRVDVRTLLTGPWTLASVIRLLTLERSPTWVFCSNLFRSTVWNRCVNIASIMNLCSSFVEVAWDLLSLLHGNAFLGEVFPISCLSEQSVSTKLPCSLVGMLYSRRVEPRGRKVRRSK